MRTPEQVQSMLCSVCNSGLSMSERGGVEIDSCPTCRGAWLDRGELDKIVERAAGDGYPNKGHATLGQHPTLPSIEIGAANPRRREKA